MNFLSALVAGLICGLVAFAIASEIGSALLAAMEDTKGMITATDIIGISYIFPSIFGVGAFFVIYFIIRKKP